MVVREGDFSFLQRLMGVFLAAFGGEVKAFHALLGSEYNTFFILDAPMTRLLQRWLSRRP